MKITTVDDAKKIFKARVDAMRAAKDEGLNNMKSLASKGRKIIEAKANEYHI